ncbi:MAG TPA: reverse transcriptase family protein [Polyangia bacterium]|nr:reverse transcriptase family protein [Polyangia bacterium]
MIVRTARALAYGFLAGPWNEGSLVARGREVLDARPRWLRHLVRRVLRRFPERPPGGPEPLLELLLGDERLRIAVSSPPYPRVRRWLAPELAMIAVPGPPSTFAVPALATEGDLAAALGLTPPELAWFADGRRLNERTSKPALLHYRYAWVSKTGGGFRLLEAPKPRLLARQRWILRNVLEAIPPSPHAHGFVRGRDVRSFVRPHVGRAVVVRLDLQDFFASVTRAGVAAIFRRVGYPRPVADALANLCTAATPLSVLDAHPRDGDLPRRFLVNAALRDRHLPQGAPTSPALSNLVAWRMDTRLAGLAAGFGATMTRYADDLAFSGDETFARALRFFLPRAGAIVLEEGFRVNHRKTRVMPRGHRQELCGIAIAERPSVPRRERDRLRAILFNARRSGLESQNREGHGEFRRHLEGRVAWVRAVDPRTARRLGALPEEVVRA